PTRTCCWLSSPAVGIASSFCNICAPPIEPTCAPGRATSDHFTLRSTSMISTLFQTSAHNMGGGLPVGPREGSRGGLPAPASLTCATGTGRQSNSFKTRSRDRNGIRSRIVTSSSIVTNGRSSRLPESEVRSFTASVQLGTDLQRVLADLIELHLQGKQGHWNVVGINFR